MHVFLLLVVRLTLPVIPLALKVLFLFPLFLSYISVFLSVVFNLSLDMYQCTLLLHGGLHFYHRAYNVLSSLSPALLLLHTISPLPPCILELRCFTVLFSWMHTMHWFKSPAHQISLSLSLSQWFPHQTGPLVIHVKILDKYDINREPGTGGSRL